MTHCRKFYVFLLLAGMGTWMNIPNELITLYLCECAQVGLSNWLCLPLCSSICQKYLSKWQHRGCKCDVTNEIHHICIPWFMHSWYSTKWFYFLHFHLFISVIHHL